MPFVGVTVYWVLVLAWASVSAACLFLLVIGLRRKKRSWIWLGGVPLLMSFVAFLKVLRDENAPPEAQARSLVALPPEAHIVEVERGDWDDGTVTFRLPATRVPAAWIRAVWDMNSPHFEVQPYLPKPILEKKSSVNWKWEVGDGDSYELSYDASTHLYEFDDYVDA